MINLLKYQFKGENKFLLGIYILMSILAASIFIKQNTWQPGVAIVWMTLLNIVAFVVIFFYLIRSFGSELYGDKRYLTFTLPVKGQTLVGSKIIYSFLNLSFLILVGSVLQIFTIKASIPQEELIKVLNYFSWQTIALILISIIIMSMFLLQTIFFAITISKMTFKNKNIGKVGGFIIFIVFSIILGWLENKLALLFPQNLIFDERIIEFFNLSTIFLDLNFNISMLVFDISVFIILFFLISYIIEKKIDL